jgi:hypothetical protein
MEEIKKKKGRPKKIKEETPVQESVVQESVVQETEHRGLIQDSLKEDLPFPLNFVKNVYDIFLGKR